MVDLIPNMDELRLKGFRILARLHENGCIEPTGQGLFSYRMTEKGKQEWNKGLLKEEETP